SLPARRSVREGLHHREGRSPFAERRVRPLGEPEVTTKWGVPPRLIGDVLALSGDSVDNIPSAGIGRKTAANLLVEHGDLDSLLANLERIKSVRTREKLIAGREQIQQNRKMVELD